jgi:outer membrane lipopolysaccharide assembly protein LptE/RlpB
VNRRTQVLAATLAPLALVVASCAYTTSTALLPSHLKTLAVPVFENGTTEYTLEQAVTDAVIARFVADNHLKIVDERSADAVIKGRLTAYRNAVFGFSQTAQAQEYRVTLSASVTFKDKVKNRELWSEPNLVKTSNYYVVDTPGALAKTELDGRKEAIAKLAEEIVARSVEGW